jgi:uridine phosphorylase
MGGPSVGIGIEELARVGITHFIRVGTTGAIQENIDLGEVIINNAAVRLDGTSKHYAPLEFPAVASFDIVSALVQGAKENEVPYHLGISASSDTFWPGQERYDSFTGYVPRDFQGSLKEWQALGVLNYEMETSALFVIAKIFGLEAGSICAAVAKRTDSEAVAKGDYYATGMARIGVVLRRALQILISESR